MTQLRSAVLKTVLGMMAWTVFTSAVFSLIGWLGLAVIVAATIAGAAVQLAAIERREQLEAEQSRRADR